MALVFQMANPWEYLAITGHGIDDVKLAKRAWIEPGQHCDRIDISPVTYTFKVQAMSADKIPFVLPAVFTVGPRADDMECLLRYAYSKLISPSVQSVIESESRGLAASMTMEQIFLDPKSFKEAVFENVQLELNQVGLVIYNANWKQLVDVPGHEYFSYLEQARMKGEAGGEESEGIAQQLNAAKVDGEARMSKAVADYEMKVRRADRELYNRHQAAEKLNLFRRMKGEFVNKFSEAKVNAEAQMKGEAGNMFRDREAKVDADARMNWEVGNMFREAKVDADTRMNGEVVLDVDGDVDYEMEVQLAAMGEDQSAYNYYEGKLAQLGGNYEALYGNPPNAAADRKKPRHRATMELGEERIAVERSELTMSAGAVSEAYGNSGTPDLEAARSQATQFVAAGPSKEKLVTDLWSVSFYSLFVGVFTGVHQPAATGSIFARHQVVYYSVVAGVLAAVPVEMATAFCLRRTRNTRFHAFAEGVHGVGVMFLSIASAVCGFQLTIKA